ncbi:MAG: hypothetical protein ABRQ39_32550 [Candidatus Eremiobacterota bacterium]
MIKYICFMSLILLFMVNCGSESKIITTTLPDATSTPVNDNSEDSSFGIFTAYSVHEFGYFTDRAGLSREDYWLWTDKHFQNLGSHWTRSNLQLIWDFIEPDIGKGYNWNNIMLTDDIIKHIYSSTGGVNWLGVFAEGGTVNPPGRMRRKDRPPLRNPLEYPEEYKNFVKTVVERYDGDGISDAVQGVKVKYWQAGNEIFIWQNSGRSLEDYKKFVRLISEGAKEADSEAKIVLIAPTDGFTENPFLLQVIKELASEKAFNVIDVHHWGRADNWKMPAVTEYRNLLDSYGLKDVQIWSCEHGTWQGQPSGQPYQSEEEQASSLIKRYVYNLNNGLDKLFWNNLTEWYQFMGDPGSIFNSMGLITDGQGPGEEPARFNTERISYYAYKNLSNLIDTDVSKKLGRSEGCSYGQYSCDYERIDNKKRFSIIWSEKDKDEITLSASVPYVHVSNMITDGEGNITEEYDVKTENGRVTVKIKKEPLLVEYVR